MVLDRRKQLVVSWQGNNSFCCGAICMFGPDLKALAASIVLILAPVLAYLGTVGIYLGQRISWAFEVVEILWLMATLTALGLTATQDPGVVPRRYEPADPELLARGTSSMTKEHHVNGRIVKTKYCLTCQTYRPPRCSHCRVCDNCVEKFDHHCPWVGTCIGKRNYRYFLAFIMSASGLCIFSCATSIVVLVQATRDEELSLLAAVRSNIVALIIAIYAFVFFCFVGSLSALHLYLLATNQTTYEHFRAYTNSSGARVNPYNIGLMGNCKQAVCASYESLLDVEPPLSEAQESSSILTAGASYLPSHLSGGPSGALMTRVTSPPRAYVPNEHVLNGYANILNGSSHSLSSGSLPSSARKGTNMKPSEVDLSMMTNPMHSPAPNAPDSRGEAAGSPERAAPPGSIREAGD